MAWWTVAAYLSLKAYHSWFEEEKRRRKWRLVVTRKNKKVIL